jgi:uncharacterized protein (TIGR03435 family)
VRDRSSNGLLLALACVAVCHAQSPVARLQSGSSSPASSSAKFEVVSIKPAAPGASKASIGLLRGRLLARNATLRELIVYAYQIPLLKVVGGPSWLDSERFTVEATAPGVLMTNYRSMLVTLLEERFGLQTRTEARDVPVYELVRLKADMLGPNVRASTVDCSKRAADGLSPCRLSEPSGKVEATGINWDRIGLDKLLVELMGRPVIDKSGLKGPVDLTLTWRDPLNAVAADGNVPTIIPALEEQLGLKLVSTTAAVDFLVIDHIERPSEN